MQAARANDKTELRAIAVTVVFMIQALQRSIFRITEATVSGPALLFKQILNGVYFNPLDYIRKTPKVVSGTGAFRLALMARPSTSRVWAGSMTPSSHRRAVA